MIRILFLLTLCLTACAAAFHKPESRQTLTFHVSREFRADEALLIRSAMAQVGAREVRGGNADIDIVREALPCTRELGAFSTTEGGYRVIRLDPFCTHSDLAFGAVVMHELFHAYGAEHVCRYPGEALECSPVGYGRAVLNPSLYYGFTGLEFNQSAGQDDFTWEPTELDFAELRRVLNHGP